MEEVQIVRVKTSTVCLKCIFATFVSAFDPCCIHVRLHSATCAHPRQCEIRQCVRMVFIACPSVYPGVDPRWQETKRLAGRYSVNGGMVSNKTERD